MVRTSNHVSNDVLIDARTSRLAYVGLVEKASFCNYELALVEELEKKCLKVAQDSISNDNPADVVFDEIMTFD